uniref:Uncharacterized protein n=1 Tax=Phlebotomus papatasi TaxID=29031 RepID=A0A1B0D2L3_PHLPP
MTDRNWWMWAKAFFLRSRILTLSQLKESRQKPQEKYLQAREKAQENTIRYTPFERLRTSKIQRQNTHSTSTRKPRLNSALVAQQAATLPGASSGVGLPNGTGPKPPPGSTSAKMSSRNKHKHTKKFARLKNVDRSSAQTREVTVNSVTVVITEYKPKPIVNRRESSDQSLSESNDSRS